MKATTIPTSVPLIQLVDGYVDREYYKINSGLVFTTRQIVRKENIGHDLILYIETKEEPTRIFYNGKECKIVEINNQ